MRRGAIAPVSTAPAAVISASCCACDVPLANVTMYGTNGPEGGALVVVGAVVVVPDVVVAAEDVDGVVVVAPVVSPPVVNQPVLVDSVVVAEPLVVVPAEEVDGTVVVPADEVDAAVVVPAEEVEAVVVVVGAVLAEVDPEAAPVDVDELSLPDVVEVVSLDVELEKVLPIVIGETSPSAPETSRPSANTAATPTMTRI
jgi:ribonuclease E